MRFPILWLCVLALTAGAAEPAAKVLVPYVFTDETATVELAAPATEVAYELACLSRAGLAELGPRTAPVAERRFQVQPGGEGVYVLRLQQPKVELRFLALAPPLAIAPAALRRALPRQGARLLAGEPFTIVGLGDSVTATGDFLGILGRLLERATGNRQLRLVKHAYPGRSVDATVRGFAHDCPPERPQLGLLMYGLNDQAAGVPLAAYLEQYAWVARHLAEECQADTVFLQPTPHIDIPVAAEARRPESNPPEYAFRTIGFAAALRPLAAELKVPLAETFQALWGPGGATIEDSARALHALYPPSYRDQWRSLLETAGKGDTIHPNVLGHLQLARATYTAIAGQPPPPAPLELTAVSEWTPEGVVSRIVVRNAGTEPRQGRLAVYPLRNTGALALAGDGTYRLIPGQAATFTAAWQAVRKPEDLLRFPANTELTPATAYLACVDFAAGQTRVYGVAAPLQPDVRFARTRQIVTGPGATVVRQFPTQTVPLAVSWPPETEVGRLPLLEPVTLGEQRGWIAGEVVYVRFAQALPGEATMDGKLDEWSAHHWSPVGEPVQARWTAGPDDRRASPDECYLRWAFKAGQAGIFVAVAAKGEIAEDRFTVFLDKRAPAELGTVGPYYWVNGQLEANGKVKVGRGETTPNSVKLAPGAWTAADDGTKLEFLIPYSALEAAAWPDSGDLGLSIQWTHKGPGGNTQLQWSEDGHPWNTRWYGAVRRQTDPAAPLPYVVHVK